MYKIVYANLLALCLVATSAFGMSGTVENFHYYSSDGVIKIAVPKISSLHISDGQWEVVGPNGMRLKYVDFTPDQYWMMDYMATVEWLNWSPDHGSLSNRKVLRMLPNHILHEDFKGARDGKIKNCQDTQFRGSPAYACEFEMTLDNTPATVKAISFITRGHIINAFCLFPRTPGNRMIQKTVFQNFIHGIYIKSVDSRN